MKRALSTGIVLLFAAIVAVAVISTTHRSDGITALLTLNADGMPDISHIQTGPATPAQIAAQMKKDGLSLHLFSAVRTPPPTSPSNHLRTHFCAAPPAISINASFCATSFAFSCVAYALRTCRCPFVCSSSPPEPQLTRAMQLPPAYQKVDLEVKNGKPTSAQVKAALAMQKIMMQDAAHDDKLVAEIKQTAASVDGPLNPM